MLEQKDEWKILKAGSRSDFLRIAAITVTFILVIAFNIIFIFQMTAEQTEEIGQMQLEEIRSDLQGSIDNAERMALRLAARAEQMLAAKTSQEDIKKFFEHEQREQKLLSNGECFNVYIANKDWSAIPNFNMPADFQVTKRNWYTGAAQNAGKVFITEPYLDAAGHGLCFTVSIMLSDKNTVVALDFNFTNVQNSIKKMDTGNDRTAFIVTKEGLIIGFRDEIFVGEELSKALPEYKQILATVLNSPPHENFKIEIDDRSNTVFSSETSTGWQMILCIDDYSLYKDDYRHLMINSAVNILMIVVILFYYFKGMKNRLQAQKALQIKEEFLRGLSKELHAPLQKILKLSNVGILSGENAHAENSTQIRESALKLSDMLNNLLSFSNIVTEQEKTLEIRAEKNLQLSKVSRTARQRIIVVLTVALIFRIGISIYTNIGWGDTKMTREVEIYEHRLSNWIVEQKTILNMFASVITERPEIMNDYSAAVKFLDGIAKDYPEISACYFANPDKAQPLIMNDGWVSPDPSWRVELRPWYIETESSSESFTVSTPYIDSRTGNYCVTIAKVVYGKNGEFLGIFGIDFYLDRLIQILDASYTNESYAFLVDKQGQILNHPNINYQMTADKMTDISATEYAEVFKNDEDFLVKDFRNNYMTCVAKKNKSSGFTVVVANSWHDTYGQVILFPSVFIIIYIICVGLVVALINQLIKWQTAVQKKLKDAAKTALNAGQAKSQFLAQMSHEIRTPINAVLGFNEMILRESNDKDIHDYAENISNAGRTLLNLINSILDFSKIEDGKMEIIPVSYEVLGMIDDLVNMIYDKANKKKISLITKIDPKLPKTLLGDDMRIKQVITNLLTNAVKYTKQGTVTLTMSGEIIDENYLMLFVSVKDTGIGIRQEDIEKLFESFIRLDETKNKNIEGTGLGISIVKELLLMMNSRLEVSSVYGEGSDFSFRLPQKIIDKTPIGIYGEHHAERKVKHVETQDFIKAPGARILAVDDTSLNLKVINGLLKRNLIVPDLADSGEKCLMYAKKYFYHIIFLDHMMPEMDGVETLKRLKKMNLPAETKIVVLTANAISGAREKYLAWGFDDYLSKPIDVDALENILSKYLPPEIIRGDDEDDDESPAQIEEAELLSAPPPVDEEEETDEDSFSKKERRDFEKICPSIDLDTALSNCMDSKEFFAEMAEEFVATDKTAELEETLAAEDWKDYRIAAHALKSTSLVIGAVNLHEKAKAQEFAARDGKIDALKENHADLIETYKKVREELEEWLTKK
ncbi:MAG: response regulator [Selenomonadaceae bacterium]|nr:response regulator [Selenomonadaceae bacterium]